MKKMIAMSLCMTLLLAQGVCASPSETMEGIYEALLDDGSLYTDIKTSYQEYYPDMVFEETLGDNEITVSVSDSGFMDGSWDFTCDGDYLTAVVSDEDFFGMMMTTYITRAVADYFGMNGSLVSGYINGVSILGIENDNFVMTEDGDSGTARIRINIAGPWDMKELDRMVLDKEVLDYEPLGEEHSSITGNVGRVMTVANGTRDDLTVLIGEYGGLDDLAYQSIINIAGILQPAGWEEFTAGYTELADADTAGYTVVLDVDEAAVREVIDDMNEEYSYAVIHFTGK